MSAFNKAWNLLKNYDPNATANNIPTMPTPSVHPEDTKPTAPYASANYPKTPQQRQTPCPSCGGSGFVMQTSPNYGPKDSQMNYGGQQP